jgi:diguanylate cyclase (GGDEF)-like protein
MDDTSSIYVGIILVPAVTAAMLYLVFTYLVREAKSGYFRLWQYAWAAYAASYGCLWFYLNGQAGLPVGMVARLLFACVPLLLYFSTRCLDGPFKPRFADAPLSALTLAWAAWGAYATDKWNGSWMRLGSLKFRAEPALIFSAIILVAAGLLLRHAWKRHSTGLYTLAGALAFWGALLLTQQFHWVLNGALGKIGHFLGPVPQIFMGIAMLMVLYDDQRRDVNRALKEAQRRAAELELMTQVGAVIASKLDRDEVLPVIHRELGRLFDVSTFYIAFTEGQRLEFVFEMDDGTLQPARGRKLSNGFSEYIIRNNQPLLIERDLEARRDALGVVAVARPAKCFCGVPIVIGGKATGVMAALNYEKENVYAQHDLEIMQIAAGQVAVAIENARLFSAEQRRARYLGFLNNVSKSAISSQNADEMLEEIVREIQSNFHYDHIGVGIVDYNSKEIEIKAEAGSTARSLGKKLPLGVGIMGRVARTNQMSLEQGADDHLLGVIPDARSVCCIPITYSETLLGILNVESKRESAFTDEDVLMLRTLADLLATALHNVYVFQKMEQQSITDPLTGIKTRRFFTESLQGEWKRASRSGRPFSVVLIDLDKFKQVNDGMGHLEGDLVLARIGRLLDSKVRQSNVVARYGGDEFIILMPETGVDQAQILSERLRLWIATDPMLNERHITGSFGVATYPVHGSSIEDIIRIADSGMYISKRAGGNKVSSADVAPENAEDELQHVITSYMEQFMRREHTPTVAEIVTTLQKLSASVPAGQLVPALIESIRTLNRSVEMQEMHSAGHGDAVASYAEAIGRELSLHSAEMADLKFAGIVHNVGKIVIPDKVLNKPGALTFDEYQLVKQHSTAGAEILSAIPNSDRLQKFVRYHHERYDGQGYPEGLKGEEIPTGARIIAVAEAYVNMIAERPYGDPKTPEQAMVELERMSGTQFDGMLVRVLLHQLKGRKKAAHV